MKLKNKRNLVFSVPRFIAPLISVFAFFRKLDIKILHFIIPAFLSMGTAVFEGISLGLLIPLAKGAIYQDFGFARELPVFKNIIAILPAKLANTDFFIFTLIVTLIFVSVVLKNALRYFASLGIAYQAGRFTSNLRKAVFNRYLGFGKLFFDRSGSAYLNTVVNEFPVRISQELLICQYVLTAFFTLFVYILLMFLISWQLSIAVLVAFPVLHYSIRVLIGKIKKTSETQASRAIRINKKALDVIRGITLVKLYNRGKKEGEEFNGLSDLVRKAELSMAKKTSLIQPVQEIITTLMILFLIVGVAFIVAVWKIKDISGFLLFFILIRRSAVSLGVSNVFRSSMARIDGPIKELKKAFDDGGKFFVKGGGRQLTGLHDKIEFGALNFSYIKNVPVLKDINFAVRKGEVTAIVGSTGSGKTTIISLLLRFYECPSSSIFVDGVDIRDYTLESLRRHIALVSQETVLFNDTIRKNIAYGFDSGVSDNDLVDVLKRARLYKFVQSLPDGLDTIVGDMGVRLSGGEKQRVSIARALLKGSEILILDEATSSLDSHTEGLIQRAIEEAVKGRTTIVIAHRLSTIKNADKIVVIENGSVIEQGTLQELLDRKGRFYEYWEEQKFF